MLDTIATIQLAAALILGIFLGGAFFCGLWWTVRRLPQSRHPVTLYLGSMALRLGIAVLGFYVVLNYYDWPQLAACLVGFLAARITLVRFALMAEHRVEKAT